MTTGLGLRIPQHVDEHRLDLTQGHTVSKALFSLSFKPGVRIRPIKAWGRRYPIIETNSLIGKRKALAASGTLVKAEDLVVCWDMRQESVSSVPASRIKKQYNGRNPLLPDKSKKAQINIVFPLCSDHLITLLQFNALRALAVNRTLITGILVTPLDCDEEIIHVIPFPTKPELLPPSLLPTTLQQTVPHADWVDMFPCPEARDRLILAAGTFDEDDLWADCIGGLYEGFPDDEIERRGIIAWSPPWDISGWEMSEGFLRKWGWLFKGLPGPLVATNRWRMQRGEDPLVHDDYTSHAT
ncbi:hypothetical protein ACLOAV_010119 [Pseudogymnoascus australis]